MLKIEHIPNFNNSVLCGAANQVVLVENVVLVLLFRRLEFVGRNIFKINSAKFMEGLVTRL